MEIAQQVSPAELAQLGPLRGAPAIDDEEAAEARPQTVTSVGDNSTPTTSERSSCVVRLLSR
jgi:hypothetical protein